MHSEYHTLLYGTSPLNRQKLDSKKLLGEPQADGQGVSQAYLLLGWHRELTGRLPGQGKQVSPDERRLFPWQKWHSATWRTSRGRHSHRMCMIRACW